MMGWNNGYGDGYGSHGIGMVLVMLLFWIPLIGLGIWLVARATRPGNLHAAPTVHASADAARGILDRRFASGEINAEQYTEMRRVLDAGAHL
jgi:putative membrane protein